MKIKKYMLIFFLWPLIAWSDDYLRLITLERLKDYPVAIDYALTIQPTLDTEIVLARLYMRMNQLPQAQAILTRLLFAYPQDSDLYLLKIMAYEQQGNWREVLKWTDIAVLFFPLDSQFYSKRWSFKKSFAQNNQDVDAVLKSAQLYFQKKQYTQVINLLEPLLQKYPKYTDLYAVTINATIALKQYSKALDICHQGLLSDPKNPVLLKKQVDLQSLLNAHPKLTMALPKQNKIFLNEVGVFNQLYYISDRKQLWDYTTLLYGRTTAYGKAFGKLNYANRLQKQALQYEFEFFPKLGQWIYFDLDASVANQPILFPHYSYGGEAFVVLPELFQFSIGDQLNRITSNIHFSRMTVSWSKEVLKGIQSTLRTYVYFPASGQKSIFYTLNLRQMFNHPDNYYGMIVGTGTTPDLANLETVNFLVLKNTIMLSPYVNFAAFHEQLIVNLSFLYQNQVFPNNRIREWLGGTMGMTWRF